MPSRAVLFDADGVLVDSSATYRRVWTRWALHHDLDPALVWAATHGRRPTETVAEVAPLLDVDLEHARLLREVALEDAPFPLYPGVPELLASLPPRAWAVVTSGRDDAVRARLRAGGAPEPAVVVDGGVVLRGKPDPEGYLLAADVLDVAPADCLVVEDSPAGVAAGSAAGMRVLGLTTTHPPEALAGADEVLGSFCLARQRICSWLDGFPLDR
ncbi:sugar-phosphatase [Motilibacter rhizosphaerae]|uniref:Sugar-phosphatase n=1 Tax=Motilibacter rhizosphaerae TaxID=598652 RepID=A0A4Q7NWH8_9ACTN|nr:HAD-IA family hydrolase [Motilibacter rhizosphaerae]RZS91567.1 sugar-phosphatase [Motilibacter rhizosphaerae]